MSTMRIELLPGSFTPASADEAVVGKHYAARINGRVQVTDGRRVFDTWAIRTETSIAALGFVGRYLTSSKPWRAQIVFYFYNAATIVRFGRDDRSGNFNKQNAVSFEPDRFFAI